jgi:hypothetical protein
VPDDTFRSGGHSPHPVPRGRRRLPHRRPQKRTHLGHGADTGRGEGLLPRHAVRLVGRDRAGRVRREEGVPANNDDITGPCDEFGNTTPLNFKDAKPGERFLKIGVGELTKGTDNEYAFWKKYAIAKAGTWDVPKDETAIAFRQTVTTDYGYGYKYAKQIKLADGTAGFQINYRFVNTGTKRIETDVYNHNFFNVAGAGTGKGFGVTFPFSPKPVDPKERFRELVAVEGDDLKLKGELDQGSIYTILEGYGDTARDARFELRGGGVKMTATGDRPLSKVAVWGVKRTLCPEPFFAIRLAPGEQMVWSWKYEFSVAK